MSFLKQGSSIVKPAIIVVAILLIVGGLYSLTGGSKQQVADSNNRAAAPTANNNGSEIQTAQDVEAIVAKWVADNPQAILDSVSNMQRKAAEAQAKDAQKNIAKKKDELENSDSPAIAPAGYDVTIVEFFDYSCGYCKKAHKTVLDLLKEDKKVRVVFKEFPILGQASLEMSQVAVAVSLVDEKLYVPFHNALMESSVRSKEAAIEIAKKVGVDGSKLEAVLKNDQDKITKILQKNAELGRDIGINGTPGFVIGDELIPGALNLASFKAKIAAERAK